MLNDQLAQRRQAVDDTLKSLGARVEEFEGVMHTFTSHIDDAFRKAEARARDTGVLLSQSTQEVSGVIEQRFVDVRDMTAKERERTSAALRAAYEQANAELNDIFGQAGEKFRAAAEEIRNTAFKIQQELETTRQELRRGATDLPRETTEQTAAMRRVVAEQIKALNDLTDIVARSGRAFDVSESTLALAAPEPARIAAVGAGAGRPRAIERPVVAAERPAQAEPTPFPERPRAPAPIPRLPETGSAAPGFASEPPRPRQPAPGATAPRIAPPPAAERNNVWLSDLLARASRDEEAILNQSRGEDRAAPRPSQPLEALGADIARMVDTAGASDAWARHYRGERNAFSPRRLYTAAGQQTYEEIRRRYVNDPSFRDTVDRYTEEFERLATEVARDDPDGSRIKAFYVSDSGKVYTLLGHASGRLE
jgi:hypothetical protein